MRNVIFIIMIASFRLSTLAEEDYYPLRVGNEWTMAAVYTVPQKGVANDVFHQRISSTVVRDGKTYFSYQLWTDQHPKKINSADLDRKVVNAVYTIDTENKGSSETISLALPLKVGASWRQPLKGRIITKSVIGLETVKASEKTYEKCFHIRSTSSDRSYKEDTWLASGVGYVKVDHLFANGVRFTQTLKEFRPGP